MIILKHTYLLFSFLALSNAMSLSLYAMDDLAIVKQQRTPETLKHLCFSALAKQHYKERRILADFTKTLDPKRCSQDLCDEFAQKWIPNSIYEQCKTQFFLDAVLSALQSKASAQKIIDIVETHAKHPDARINTHCINGYCRLSTTEQIQQIEHYDSEKKLYGQKVWNDYKYILTDAPDDLSNVIVNVNNKTESKEKISRILKNTNDHNNLMHDALLLGINPIPTIQELVRYASDKHNSNNESYYILLKDMLSLEYIQPWLVNLRKLRGSQSILECPTRYANCKVLELLAQHNLAKFIDYDPFEDLLYNFKHLKRFSDQAKEYINILIQHGIKPNLNTIMGTFNWSNDVDALLEKYPALAPITCSAILNLSNPISFITVIKKYGTPRDLATALSQCKTINVLKMLEEDYHSVITETDLQSVPESKLEFPSPNDERGVHIVLTHGNPFIAFLAAKKGTIAKDNIPQLLSDNTYGLLSMHLKLPVKYIPTPMKDRSKQVWDYYKHIVQCQLNLADDEISEVDLTTLEKSILKLQEQSFFKRHGNALLLGMGKPISLLISTISSYFSSKKNHTTKNQEPLKKTFVSSLPFTNNDEKNAYYKAMQSALYDCKLLTTNHWNSPYFRLRDGYSSYDIDNFPELIGLRMLRFRRIYSTPIDNQKDLRPIENLILSKTPWYERHGNKIFGLYCGLLLAGTTVHIMKHV